MISYCLLALALYLVGYLAGIYQCLYTTLYCLGALGYLTDNFHVAGSQLLAFLATEDVNHALYVLCQTALIVGCHRVNSSITVIDSMQVQPEMIYAEEGQGLTDGEELDHLADLVRADGTWVYYGVPAENFFIVTWMPDAEAAEAKIAALREEGDCVACCVDLAEEWNFG